MAFEIPFDQIRQLQISLLKEAGLSYNPEDEISLPNLPSVKDSISQLDPSPSYLRCKHCNGRFLRGVDSVICVFCGRQQNKDAPPIQFTSTFGCRWFFQSLQLDGSELVTPSTDGNESNRGQNTPEVEFPLSELLNLEIRWPSEPENYETGLSEKASQSRNLAGVNIDNYFSESKVDSASPSTEGQLVLNKLDESSKSNAFKDHTNLSLFENIEPSETVVRPKKDDSGDSFSAWEADFQSADSATQPQEPKFSDPFAVSSSVDLSSQMDAVFGPGKDITNENTKESVVSTSNVNDWFEGDIWSNANASVTGQNNPVEDMGPKAADSNTGNLSFANDDWIQDNQWDTLTSSSKAADNKTVDEVDDSFDDWNEFTTSNNVQVPTSNPLKDNNQTVPSVEQASEISWFSGPDNSKDIDSGGLSQPDFFSTTFSSQNGSSEMNTMMPESSVLDRMGSLNGTEGGRAEDVEKSRNFSDENTESKANNVEALMLQMHDLSFMLADDLAVPQKKDSQSVDLFS